MALHKCFIIIIVVELQCNLKCYVGLIIKLVTKVVFQKTMCDSIKYTNSVSSCVHYIADVTTTSSDLYRYFSNNNMNNNNNARAGELFEPLQFLPSDSNTNPSKHRQCIATPVSTH